MKFNHINTKLSIRVYFWPIPLVLVLEVVLQDMFKIHVKRILNSTHTAQPKSSKKEIPILWHSRTVSKKDLEHTIAKSSSRQWRWIFYLIFLELGIKDIKLSKSWRTGSQRHQATMELYMATGPNQMHEMHFVISMHSKKQGRGPERLILIWETT
jgi:hypothetical protein